jgi:hypothetical protein
MCGRPHHLISSHQTSESREQSFAMMNRFKSDSINASSVDEIEFTTPQDMVDEERDSLLPSDENDLLASPGRNKKQAKYFDIEMPISSGSKVGSLRPFTQLLSCCKCRKCCCQCSKKKKVWCKRIFYLCSFLLISFILLYQQDLRLYFGYRVFDPYPVSNTTISVHDMCEFKHIRTPSILAPAISYTPQLPIPCFDDPITTSDNFLLPRAWDVLPANSCINISHLNSNVCIEAPKGSSEPHSITCLPSFMIIGFEKASTTELLLWLSYHPNLLGKWAETRFFSKVTSSVSGDQLILVLNKSCVIFLFDIYL